MIGLLLGASVLLAAPDIEVLDEDLAPPQMVQVSARGSIVEQRHQLLSPWLPGVMLQAIDELPAFPWDPFVLLLQRAFNGIGAVFVVGGCVCCVGGIVAAIASFAISARKTGNEALDAVLVELTRGFQYFLVVSACLVFTPPTLFLWGGSVPWFLGAQAVDVFKSPRQRAIEAEQARLAAEQRRIDEERRRMEQQNNPNNQVTPRSGVNTGNERRPTVRSGQPHDDGNGGHQPAPSSDGNRLQQPAPQPPRAAPAPIQRNSAEEERKRKEEEERKKQEEEERKKKQVQPRPFQPGLRGK